MPITFTEAKRALDEIAERTSSNTKRLANGRQQVNAAQADLIAMATAYSQIVADIESEQASDPTNVAWLNLKAQKDEMVADFQAARSDANALKTAMDGA